MMSNMSFPRLNEGSLVIIDGCLICCNPYSAFVKLYRISA